MNNKLTLFIDVDGTVINSLSAMCIWYNHAYQFHPNFKPAISSEIYEWNAGGQMPLLQKGDIELMFASDLFFQVVEPIKNSREVIERLTATDEFDCVFASIGSSANIGNKTKYLEKVFPFVSSHIMLVKNGSNVKMDKTILNGEGTVLIDDHIDNLKTARVTYPILFKENGIDKEWNQGWNGLIATSWLEVEDILHKLHTKYNVSVSLN